MSGGARTAKRWGRDEYRRLGELGFFATRVELVAGEIHEVGPQSTPHATSVRLATRALEAAFAAGHDVRSQLPLALGDDSEEPGL